MSNSSLVTYTDLSPNWRDRRGTKIDTITIHCMAGQCSVEVCGEIFHNRVASSNYGIGPDGRVALYVEEKNRSICTSSTSNDIRAITIEVASDSTSPYAVNDTAYNTLILLLVDICQRNNIPKLLWQGDKNLIGHVDKQNMTVHRWFSTKSCPGDYLYNLHSQIAEEVNSRLGIPLSEQTNLAAYATKTTSSSSEYSTSFDPAVYYKNSTELAQLGEIDFTQTASQSHVKTRTTKTAMNSGLVNYVNRLGSKSYSARNQTISRITIHIARAIGDIHQLARLLNSSDKSYNYGIDNSGIVGLFVDESMWTKSSNSNDNDSRAVNIICMNDSLEPNYSISWLCYNSLVNLCEDICRRNFIFTLTYTGDPSTDSLTLHQQFNSASKCPGPYLISKLQDIMNEVNSRINARIGTNYVQTSARLASSKTEALRSQSTVAVKSIKPYVIQPSSNVLNINYAALKEYGVVGSMLYAGERYNEKHELVTFRTDNIYKQAIEAKNANMPFGFIYTTRARTIDEVKEEAYWFRFVVSKYPPKLGVWLNCAFESKKSDKIEELVEAWYKYFVAWGLKSKCGLYATKKQAKLIGWPKQSGYMPLWLKGELSQSTCPDEELLTPSFFKLNDLTNYTEEEVSEAIAPATSERYTGEPSDEFTGYEPIGKSDKSGTSGSGGSSSGTKLNDQRAEKAEKTVEVDKETIKIPNDPKYRGFKSWSSYLKITAKSTPNYKINHNDQVITEENGFRMLDGRYLIVVGTGICTTIGTYIDIILENGTVIEGIMGDSKSDRGTDEINHIFSVQGSYCCSGFIIDPNNLKDKIKTSGDCSYLKEEWRSKVTDFKVHTKNWFAKE